MSGRDGGGVPRRIAVLTSDDGALAHGEEADAIAVSGVREVADRVGEACESLGMSVARVRVTRDPARLLADLERVRPDAAFHLAESVGGDARMEASVAALLDWIALPYTGSPPLALAHALDKPVARALLAAHGVPVAAGALLEHGDEPIAPLAPPWIVKPSREDASHGIHLESVAWDEASARGCARRVIERYRQPALIEEFAPGRELHVALLGPSREPTPLPVFEVDFSGFPAGAPRLVTYAAKWRPESDEYRGTRLAPARDLETALARRVRRIACGAYRALGLRGYGRVDLRIDRGGNPIVVDVNPNPDLGPDEVLARSAAHAGVGYASLIEWLVDQALGKPGGPAIPREA
jgi:D-alanine-D-alanine ligase